MNTSRVSATRRVVGCSACGLLVASHDNFAGADVGQHERIGLSTASGGEPRR